MVHTSLEIENVSFIFIDWHLKVITWQWSRFQLKSSTSFHFLVLKKQLIFVASTGCAPKRIATRSFTPTTSSNSSERKINILWLPVRERRVVEVAHIGLLGRPSGVNPYAPFFFFFFSSFFILFNSQQVPNYFFFFVLKEGLCRGRGSPYILIYDPQLSLV